MSYLMALGIFGCIYVLLTLSLNLAVGYTGLLNLGHIAFYGIGAYASALLVLAGVPYILALILSAIIAGLFSLIISIPSLRLKGHYFAIATFGFSEIIRAVVKNWDSLTRGPMGIYGIPTPEILGFSFNTPTEIFSLYLVITIIIVLAVYRIVNSPFGRILKSVRDDEIASKALGKNTTSYKIQAVFIGALIAGIAGSMYSHYIMFVDPSMFMLPTLVFVFSMVVAGGLGSVLGSVLGAIILSLLPEPLRFLPIPSAAVGAIRMLLFSGIIILMILFRPEGIIKEKTFKVEKC